MNTDTDYGSNLEENAWDAEFFAVCDRLAQSIVTHEQVHSFMEREMFEQPSVLENLEPERMELG